MATWIMPCNVKHLDIVSWFKEKDSVVWKASTGIRVDDTIYVYVGAPYSKILFLCKVINDKIDKSELSSNEYARVGKKQDKWKYMQLRLVYTYENGIPLSKLQELGMYSVQRQVRLNPVVLTYISSVNKQLGIEL